MVGISFNINESNRKNNIFFMSESHYSLCWFIQLFFEVIFDIIHSKAKEQEEEEEEEK
jgi:hypothetical protein